MTKTTRRWLAAGAVLSTALIIAGCGNGPAAPTGADLGPGGLTDNPNGTVTATNNPPTVVFKTRPAADENDTIHGRVPITIRYNMCDSRDADIGDQLKFKYDFEGDGEFVRGICRAEYLYQDRFNKATVCASDRQPMPGHEICKTYKLDLTGDGGPQGT